MLPDPALALADQSFWREATCRRWLEHAYEHIHFDLPEALNLAILGVRLARRVVRRQEQHAIRHRCILARAYAVLGSVYRAMGVLKKAEHALEKAAALAARCTDPDERSNIHMRRAILCAYQAQQPDGTFDPAILKTGLALADTAIRVARCSVAMARAHNAHGILEIRAGNLGGAVHDARTALSLLGPIGCPYDHVSALSVLVSALTRGSKADRGEAIAHLVQLREALPRRSPVLRARLLWAEALLYIPDRQRKGRAGHLLVQARSRFLKHRMQAEAIAVTADLARLQPTGAVEELCAELLPILDAGPLRDLVEKLGQIRLFERADVAEQLRAALDGPGLLPAAAWPPP